MQLRKGGLKGCPGCPCQEGKEDKERGGEKSFKKSMLWGNA